MSPVDSAPRSADRKDAPKGKHILVVEDEQHLAIGLKFNLEAEGYRVTATGDGPSALKIIDEHADGVDLVILDLMLPGMSGYAVCESLRASGRNMPILILTARTLTEDRTRGFEVGADQYMMKPFDLDELLSRINNLLTLYRRRAMQVESRPASVASFSFANATINFETFEATMDGEPVRLTHLEMKLLQYFVANEGRVIPRQELLENVWSTSGKLNTRAPDQFIRRLRKSFEQDPAKPVHFLTVRDAGYRFVSAPESG
jgi:two-component system alkaline phosphatase synthesis response regulator PhoP